MLKYILNILFPEKCIACNKITEANKICNDCWSNCSFITKPYCTICSYPFEFSTHENSICGSCIKQKPKYDRAFSLLKYDDASKKIIHNFKYHDQLHILEYLVDLLVINGKDLLANSNVIIPVPMHKHKLLKRGYNQAALLAMRIAKKTKIHYLPEALIKRQNTAPQAGLDRAEREKKIKNNFSLNLKIKEQLLNKNILLIDDVITTGATINECCKELKKANPKQIYVLSIAKRV